MSGATGNGLDYASGAPGFVDRTHEPHRPVGTAEADVGQASVGDGLVHPALADREAPGQLAGGQQRLGGRLVGPIRGRRLRRPTPRGRLGCHMSYYIGPRCRIWELVA